MLDKKLIEQLSKTESPFVRLDIICTEFERFHESITREDAIRDYDIFLEYFGIAIAVCENGEIEIEDIDFGGEKFDNINSIMTFFSDLKKRAVRTGSRVKTDTIKVRYSALLGAGFTYEFSDGDDREFSN